MQITRITEFDRLAPLSTEWNCLARGVPFRRFEWHQSWWRHYGAAPRSKDCRRELFVLAVHDDAGQLVGVAPWYLERSAAQGRVLRFLGSGEVCSDYCSVLCPAEFESEVASALADGLSGELHKTWDLLMLTGVDAKDMATRRLVAELTDRGNLAHHAPGPACWRVALPDDWDDYLASLSKSHRKQLRRLERRVLDTDRAQVKTVGNKDQLERGWDILVDLHQRRQQRRQEPGCFALRLHWLELDGRPVAAEYHLAGGGNDVYAYQAGVDPDVLDEQPGQLITVAVVRKAIEEHFRGLDFLRGNEPYKAHWRAKPQPSVRIRVVPTGAMPRLRHQAWLTGTNMKGAVKRTLVKTGLRKANEDDTD